jgi:hypothetical protein
MPQTEWTVEELAGCGGEVADIRRRGPLIIHYRDLVAFGGEAQHRAYEVRSRGAEKAGAADDPGLLAGSPLAVEFRAPVRGQGIRRIRLNIRLSLPTIEDVISRVVDEGRADPSGVPGTADVDRGCSLGIDLGAVDVRPGGCVQHDPRRRIERGRRKLDVPIGVRE